MTKQASIDYRLFEAALLKRASLRHKNNTVMLKNTQDHITKGLYLPCSICDSVGYVDIEGEDKGQYFRPLYEFASECEQCHNVGYFATINLLIN